MTRAGPVMRSWAGAERASFWSRRIPAHNPPGNQPGSGAYNRPHGDGPRHSHGVRQEAGFDPTHGHHAAEDQRPDAHH